jgi:cell division septation protein DedD
MFQTTDTEAEILIGNKQLLGIFFILAVLMSVVFTAGYMIGRGSADRKATDAAAAQSYPGGQTAPGETHALPADGGSTPATSDTSSSEASLPPSAPVEAPPPVVPRTEPVAPRTAAVKEPRQAPETSSNAPLVFSPRPGQLFLQVAAVGKGEAITVANILVTKGFAAHVAPKPDSKIYRVLVGPVNAAGELSATREALRKQGFRQVFLQRY